MRLGINVALYKYVSTMIGCGICGLAGMIYVLQFGNGTWSTNNNIEAIGWLAVALVIFASWHPIRLIWGRSSLASSSGLITICLPW
jgi:simple sugar transport system permease protein